MWKVRIAVDVMGGDHAPEQILAGALEAAPESDGEILLVGCPDAIRRTSRDPFPKNVRVVEATQVIQMCDPPVEALRRKKDSSLVVAANLVRNGEADAMISAGNTGAVAAAAHILWKCLPPISRPGIATVMPALNGRFVLIDSGATPDCTPKHLVEFAVMGSVYAQTVLGVKEPRLGLLNIGTEEAKGNALTKQTYKLLKASLPNFAGNVEGKNIFDGEFDVVVCDGFAGNVVLKTSQGMAELMKTMMSGILPKNRVLRALIGPLLRRGWNEFMKRTDYAEYGGAPLLGVNGLCFICHGHSNAKAIRNAIRMARRGHEARLNDRISKWAAEVHGEPVSAS